MNVYTIADSLTDTIQFDVIATATNQQVKNGSVVSRPSFDFIKMPSGIGFKQKLETVNGETIDYVISQAMEKKQIRLQLAWKGKDGYAKFQSFSTWIANYFNVETYHIRFSYKIGAMRRFVEVAVVDLELEGRQGNFVSAQITLQPLTPFYEEYDGSFSFDVTSPIALSLESEDDEDKFIVLEDGKLDKEALKTTGRAMRS